MHIHHGVAPQEEIAALTGLEMLQAMIEGRLPAPAMAKTLGFTLVSVAAGEAVFEGEAGPHLLNPLGTVHGGFALTLVDSAAGCAVHTTLPAGLAYTSIELKVNYLRAVHATSGPLTAVGTVVKPGRRVAFAEGEVRDAAGKVVANATSSLLVFPIPAN